MTADMESGQRSALPLLPGDMPLLIKNLLPNAGGRRTPHEIVDAGGFRVGYPEFLSRVRRLARALHELGMRRGDTIAMLDWDSHRYLECYYAIPSMGCILQTVNVRLSPDHLRYTLQHSGARCAIVHPDFLPVIAGSGIEHVIPTERLAGSDARSDYHALTGNVEDVFDFPDIDERERATIFYTSGTTGLPKGVHYTHRQIFLHTLAMLATFGTAPAQGRFGTSDVYMPITPLFHAHAWGFPYGATVLGIKQVYPGRYHPAALLRLIADEGVTFTHCVASILQMMLDDPIANDVDLEGLKMLIGGGALPEGLARRALDRGIDVFTGYGMSETGPIQTINHLTPAEAAASRDEQVRLRARAGRPILLCDVRTMDSALEQTESGTEGEVMFRAPWLTNSYWRDEAGSAALWEGGWLHSGDIGRFGDDGALHITDRSKDVIKTGGEWVSSLLLESLISTLDGVAEVAVIGVPDTRWGERPMALVISDDPDLDGAAIQAHLAREASEGVIPRYAIPERILFVKELERTSVGKLDKKTLRAKYAV